MGERRREEDGRLEESRDKVKWRGNVAGMGDVHVSARERVFLRVRVSDILLQLRVEGSR